MTLLIPEKEKNGLLVLGTVEKAQRLRLEKKKLQLGMEERHATKPKKQKHFLAMINFALRKLYVKPAVRLG